MYQGITQAEKTQSLKNSVTKRTESMIKSAGSSSGNGGQATDIDRESSNFVGEGQLSRGWPISVDG